MVLMALTTPAYAGSYSFVIGGHHIHVEEPRHCRSLSCVSWSDASRKRDSDDAVAVPATVPVAAAPATAPASAPAPVAARSAPPAPQPQVAVAPGQAQPVPSPAPVQQQVAPVAPALKPVETRAVIVTLPAPPQVAEIKPDARVDAKVEPQAEKGEPKPRVGFDLKPDAKLEPKVEQKVEIKPDTTASVTKTPAEKPQADKPAVVTKPAPSKITLQSEGDGVETPLGDWQTEGRKGLVRIEPCGTALCGYMINTATTAKGETVLINMKPKANSEWSGSIYSRASGNTYYATMTMKRPNTLRVEACVVGHYLCSGNNWTRIVPKQPDELITTREASAEPRL
jgi:hypothetical protein